MWVSEGAENNFGREREKAVGDLRIHRSRRESQSHPFAKGAKEWSPG